MSLGDQVPRGYPIWRLRPRMGLPGCESTCLSNPAAIWLTSITQPKGMFDVDLAEEHASTSGPSHAIQSNVCPDATESTAVPRPTSTSTSLLPEPTVTTASGTAVDDSNKSEAEWKHTDKIGNAVVGSILGVGVLLFVFLAIRRWRSRKAAPSQTLSEADEEKGLPQVVVHAPNVSEYHS